MGSWASAFYAADVLLLARIAVDWVGELATPGQSLDRCSVGTSIGHRPVLLPWADYFHR